MLNSPCVPIILGDADVLSAKPSRASCRDATKKKRKKGDDDDDDEETAKGKKPHKRGRKSRAKSHSKKSAKEKAAAGKDKEKAKKRAQKKSHAISDAQPAVELIPLWTTLDMTQRNVRQADMSFNKGARGAVKDLFKNRRVDRLAPAKTVRIPVCTVPHEVVPVGSHRAVRNASTTT